MVTLINNLNKDFDLIMCGLQSQSSNSQTSFISQ